MAALRPFRFGVYGIPASSREACVSYARKVEALGYTTLSVSDHIFFGGLAPLVSLMAVADATTTLRVATHVLANNFRNPIMLAQEVATLDLLSDGRLELGIGAGWLALDYAAAGIPFEPGAVRVKRLEETVTLLKRLFGGEPVTFEGEFYSTQEMNLRIRSCQRPHPPFFIGGAGKRVLALAGREADIVGVNMKGNREGQLDAATISADATAQKVECVRQAAGERFDDIELHVLVNKVAVSDDRAQAVAEVARWLEGFPSNIVVNVDTSTDTILQSPYLLVGTVEQIAEDLQERRERFGISYITVNAAYVDAFGPVVERLAGR